MKFCITKEIGHPKLSCGCKKSLHNSRDLREIIFKTFLELSKAYSLKELYLNMNKDCSYDELPAFMMIYLKPLKHLELGSLRSLQRHSLTAGMKS